MTPKQDTPPIPRRREMSVKQETYFKITCDEARAVHAWATDDGEGAASEAQTELAEEVFDRLRDWSGQ